MTFPPEPVRRARCSRWSAAAVVVAVTLVTASVPAAPAPAPAGPAAIAGKQAEAAAIAASLEEQRDRVSGLTEDLNEARIEADAASDRAAGARRELARTESELATVSDRLKRRLVDVYTNGGGRPPMLAMLTGGPVEEMAVRRAYVDVVADQERLDVEGLEIAREERDRRRREMDDAEAAADDLLGRVEQRRAAAERAVAAERALLARAQGELAGLVEAERQRRAEEEARQAEAALEARRTRENATRLARLAAASTTTTSAPARVTTTTRATPTARPAPASSTTTTTAATDPGTETDEPATDAPSAARPPPPGAAAAIAEARRQLGKPYQYGSPGPDSFDCSGLTSWAWRAGGKSLPHSSRAQMSVTTKVPVDQIEPGDLVFYGDPVHHVGLYAGNGQMVEASQTGTPVRMASIYRRDLVGVGRVR